MLEHYSIHIQYLGSVGTLFKPWLVLRICQNTIPAISSTQDMYETLFHPYIVLRICWNPIPVRPCYAGPIWMIFKITFGPYQTILYHSIPYWTSLDQFGSFGPFKTNFGTVWSYLELFRANWSHLEPFRAIQSHLEPFGAFEAL